MAHILDTTAYLDGVCQMLAGGASQVPIPVKGVSMRPFLRDGNFVYVNLPGDRIRKGDILLFQRSNGQYVLHRVMKIQGERLWMQGDSQLQKEIIHIHQVRARAVSARIQGEIITERDPRWWKYSHPWRWLAPIRRQISWMHHLMKGN